MQAAANQSSTNISMLQDLLRNTPGETNSILVTQGIPLVPEYLEMEFRSRGKNLIWRSSAMERTLEAVVAMDANVNFVTLQDQNIIGAPGDAIPGEGLQPALMKYYSHNPGWQLASQYPTLDGKKVYLFERIPKQ